VAKLRALLRMYDKHWALAFCLYFASYCAGILIEGHEDGKLRGWLPWAGAWVLLGAAWFGVGLVAHVMRGRRG
jgi:hypothetical protein